MIIAEVNPMTNSDEYPQKDSTQIILAQLKDIASSVMYAAEASSVEMVLERIAQVSRQLVRAKYAALGVPDHEGGLRFFKVSGMTAEQIARLDHLPIGKGLIGAIMEDRASIRLVEMRADSRSAGFCPAHPKMTSLLGVPVQVGRQLFGTLYLCDREDGEPFSETDEWLVETLAGYAALAIAGSQLGEQQKKLMLLEERERIGMELHDGVIQSLYAIGMHLDLMRLSGESKPDDMGGVIHNLNDVIEDIRRYIMNLNLNDGAKKTIRESLREIIDRLHPPNSLKIDVDAPDVPPQLTPSTFEAVCQMANEAVSNAIRHAQAKTLRISAEIQSHELKIEIADDGKGFSLEDLSNHQGLGLRNIQQRAILHGGKVEINSVPNQGTRLTIRVPGQMR
jgi:signal transduction histidine kinase